MGEHHAQEHSLPLSERVDGNICSFHLILLSDADEMHNLWLPSIPEGFFRFSDSPEHRFLSISSRNGQWIAICKKPAFFQNVPLDQSCEVPLAHGQLLKVDFEDRAYSIYVEKVSREQMVYHNYTVLSDVEIGIGSQPANDIHYDSPYVSRKHAVLRRSAGLWTIQDSGSNYGVFVNGIKRWHSDLSTGDVICIMGLRIIVGTNFLSVNDASANITLNRRILQNAIPSHGGYSYHYDQDSSISKDPFFNRLPRKRLEMPQNAISVEGPPMSMEQRQIPLMLRMGSSMVMGGAAALAGNFVTLLSSVMFPFLSSKYTDKQRQEYEQLRISKYTEYLANKRAEIENACREERNFLNKKYPTISNVFDIVRDGTHLWERRPVDSDFLHVRLGTGTQPLKATIEYPARRFELESDKLEEEMYKLVEAPHLVDNVPIILPMVDTQVCGLLGQRDRVIEYIRQLVLQIATFHSYDEVKTLFFLNREDLEALDAIRYLPHAWDDQRTIRFIATDEAEAYKLGEYIKEQLPEDTQGETSLQQIMKQHPYYLIFALDKKLFESHESLKYVLQSGESHGFSIITAYNHLPKETQIIISLKSNNKNVCTTMSADGGDDVFFSEDTCDKKEISDAMRILANTRLKTVAQAQEIPKMITFQEMYKAGRIEQLNPLKRWQENNPVKSLAAPVGVGTDGSLFMLDLHEKRQGPHGLVAGTTGSGKSEFIITYILSMAFNYHPDEVAFVLIDYKGGGLTGAFENPQTGVRLPHLVGTITNLDGSSIQRSLASIESELLRRQRIFNEVKSAVNEGTMDIYAYQKLYRAGNVSEPVPHLFIISDEFAELKQQQPEFMDKLISAARIGRSLGVHLILATQKPSGVVNDQIRSNTKFRVCLRVQDRSDSMDMLKRPDAAELKDTGRFYLQVGYNEYFAMGQSAWCGAQYEPQDAVAVRRDDTLEFMDTMGQIIAKAKPKVKKTDSGMKQIVAGVKYLAEIAETYDIHPRQLWQPDLPSQLDLEWLQEQYPNKDGRHVSATIGLIDDPEQQGQYPLVLDLGKYHNALVVGVSGSGKTTFIKTMLLSLTRDYSPEKLNYYILDFSGGSLGVFKNAPHCGAFLTTNDEPEIERFMTMLKELIQERKGMFMKAGVSTFEAYTEENEIPLIVLVIDNFAGLAATQNGNSLFSSFHEYLRESSALGIQIVISCNNLNEVSARSKQELGYRIALQMKDRFAYQDALNRKCALLPAAYNGRGICVHEETTKVYQVAVPYSGLSEQARTKTLVSHIEQLAKKYEGNTPARKLPILKDDETYEQFCADIPADRLPLGYEIKSIRKISIPLGQLYCAAIYFGNPRGVSPVIENLVYAANREKMDLVLVKRKDSSLLEEAGLSMFAHGNVREYCCTAEDSLQLCHLLIDQIKARKVYRNEYCEKNDIPLSRAKTDSVMKQSAPYIRAKTKPMLILFEDFYEFSSNLQTGCFDVFKNIFENGKGYNFYFVGGFYPETKDKVSVDMLTKCFTREEFMLFFGGQFQNQGLTVMPMDYKKITSPQKKYNGFIMKYQGKFHTLVMPCGAIEDGSTNPDDAPII